jgi:peptide/nickel transport system permease protein
LVRVSVQAQSAEDYVLAAKSLGASQSRIITRHILPNVFPGLLVQVTLIMASAVLLEAEFSFLGLGSKPPEPSWGIMLNEGRNYLSQAPWLGVFAGMAITLFILGFNAFGDALQKALNPRLINR